MVDIRFHAASGPMALSALLAAASFEFPKGNGRNGELMISGAHELAIAGRSDIALAAHQSYLDDLRGTEAGAVIVLPKLADAVPPGTVAVVAERPHDLFAEILHRLYPDNTRTVVVAGAAAHRIAPLIEDDVLIGANVVIGAGVEIGSGTVVGANTVIGAGVAIGRDCIIGSNCSIDCAYLGNNVVLHAGVRIGAEGFGWLDFGRTNRKIPQLGRVVIQDGAEIGANSTIDRGALGDTVIGEGTKIDNLVQIGHNCRIGRNCLIAAMSGLSGSTILEDGVLMGGGVGTSGHLTIGAGSMIHGRAAVTKYWPAGSKLAGAPAQDIRDFWRELAMLRRMNKGDRQ